VFECQVPAIERHGGEVLKFIGDGLLAIFPFGAGETDGARCDDALDAAVDASRALRDLNEARAARGDERLRVGTALHPGEIVYGNIGSAGRLDFTCIGSAVNLASRLEGLTARVDRPVVMSAAFAALTRHPVVAVGTFELKGVAAPETVYACAEGHPLAAW
jgi:adenylate cyclase